MSVLTKPITLAHSPDSDDAFMMWAIAEKKIDTRGLDVKIIAKDIQTLNQEAVERKYDVTAVSFGAYPVICADYMLTACGGSFGDNYGPVLIARKAYTKDELKDLTIAIPGTLTSAYLALRIYQPNLNIVDLPFNEIIDAVLNHKCDAGLLIHEGQLTYQTLGLQKIVDLGEWWHGATGLDLPLGGNVIKRDLPAEVINTTTRVIKESIAYGLAHREEALAYAGSFTRNMPLAKLNRYIEMYVNQTSLDCGPKGKEAIQLLFTKAFEAGILKSPVPLDFAE